MAYSQANEDELAEMQKLSRGYEPDVKGPLVGLLQPSSTLAAEYASADPVYQAKTAALPARFSHYRTVRGDGKCGWRAVAFGYFEALIRTGDSKKFAEEEARLRSLATIIQQAGFDADLFEDFANESLGLLLRLAAVLHGSDVEQTLLSGFNDDSLQNYIITHLRTLTAAWLKTHESLYAPWLLGQTADHYCDSTILPVGAEIDHVSLSVLNDVLLSPASIGLEVLYLDRSEGSEVTEHRFDSASANGFTVGPPSVRLLYRPGHYDLLYKFEEVAPNTSASMTIFQLAATSHQPVALHMDRALALIPGLSWAPPLWSDAENDAKPLSYPSETCTDALPSTPHPCSQPELQYPPMYPPPTAPCHSTSMPQPILPDPSARSMPHGAPPLPPPPPDVSQMPTTNSPFRPSHWQLEAAYGTTAPHLTFQSNIFRNSHYNPAHFLNPEFQPEQWDPDSDNATTPSSCKSTRHKNSG